MNQLFSFPRFVKFSIYQLNINRKVLLLTVGGASVALLLLTLFMLIGGGRWSKSEWIALFTITSIISGLLLIGHSFPFLRKKESSMNMLMVPASAFEKFIYEYITKIVLFTVIYPVLFYFIAYLTLPLVEYIKPERSFAPFSFDPIINTKEKHLLSTILWAYLFCTSLAFAGASAIKRYPLIKTLVFVGAILLLGVGYFYMMLEKMDLQNGIGYVAETVIGSEDNAFIWLHTFFGVSALIALAYAYFNLKEKEV